MDTSTRSVRVNNSSIKVAQGKLNFTLQSILVLFRAPPSHHLSTAPYFFNLKFLDFSDIFCTLWSELIDWYGAISVGILRKTNLSVLIQFSSYNFCVGLSPIFSSIDWPIRTVFENNRTMYRTYVIITFVVYIYVYEIL